MPTAFGSFGSYSTNEAPGAITIDEFGMVTVAGTTQSNAAAHFNILNDRVGMIIVKTHLDINMEYDDAFVEQPYGNGYIGTKWFDSKFSTN